MKVNPSRFSEAIDSILQVYTLKEVAEHINISERTLRSWSAGKISRPQDEPLHNLRRYLKEKRDEFNLSLLQESIAYSDIDTIQNDFDANVELSFDGKKYGSQIILHPFSSLPTGIYSDSDIYGLSKTNEQGWKYYNFPDKEDFDYIYAAYLYGAERAAEKVWPAISDGERIQALKRHRYHMEQCQSVGLGQEFWIRNILFLENNPYPKSIFDLNRSAFVHAVDSYMDLKAKESGKLTSWSLKGLIRLCRRIKESSDNPLMFGWRVARSISEDIVIGEAFRGKTTLCNEDWILNSDVFPDIESNSNKYIALRLIEVTYDENVSLVVDDDSQFDKGFVSLTRKTESGTEKPKKALSFLKKHFKSNRTEEDRTEWIYRVYDIKLSLKPEGERLIRWWDDALLEESRQIEAQRNNAEQNKEPFK